MPDFDQLVALAQANPTLTLTTTIVVLAALCLWVEKITRERPRP